MKMPSAPVISGEESLYTRPAWQDFGLNLHRNRFDWQETFRNIGTSYNLCKQKLAVFRYPLDTYKNAHLKDFCEEKTGLKHVWNNHLLQEYACLSGLGDAIAHNFSGWVPQVIVKFNG